jgi:hypothetical protein
MAIRLVPSDSSNRIGRMAGCEGCRCEVRGGNTVEAGALCLLARRASLITCYRGW